MAIKDWSEDDKPREKLIQKGKNALSNSELLAILISTGSREKTAIDLAKEILLICDNDLNLLSRMGIKELTQVKGIGEAKAITIMAAIELSGRRAMNEARLVKKIKTPKDAFESMKHFLMDLNYEEFWILMLKRNNEIIGQFKVSEGGLHGTVVDPKKIFKKVLEEQASSIILFHNHPSGNLEPSLQDIDLTKKLKIAANALEISIFDHIIVAKDKFYSFGEVGKL